MTKIEILELVPNSIAGGAAIVAFECADGFSRHGRPSAVACKAGPIEKRYPQVPTFGITGTNLLKDVLALNKFIRQYGVQIVHAHLWRSDLMARIVKLLNPSLRIMITIHGSVFDPDSSVTRLRIYKLVSRLTRDFVDVVCFVSHAASLESEKQGYHPVSKQVVYDGVTTYSLKSRIEPEIPRAICIARLTKEKRVDLFVKALHAMKNPIEGIIVGDGEEYLNIRHYIDRYGVNCRMIKSNDARQFIYPRDIVVVPSDREGLSLVILEAGMAKASVIASNIGGIPEIVSHGRSGLLVPPGDEIALADALDFMVEYPDASRVMANCLHKKVKSQFSTTTMVNSYLNIINKFI